MIDMNLTIVFVAIFFFGGIFLGAWIKGESVGAPYQRGQQTCLRGGSTVIEVNESEKVVWFRTNSADSTYFYESYSKLGLK